VVTATLLHNEVIAVASPQAATPSSSHSSFPLNLHFIPYVCRMEYQILHTWLVLHADTPTNSMVKSHTLDSYYLFLSFVSSVVSPWNIYTLSDHVNVFKSSCHKINGQKAT